MSTQFLILGALEVWSDGQRIPLAETRHQRVLAMLVLAANSVLPVDRLVAAVWDEAPPPTAARQIRKIVADLRHRLPDGPSLIQTENPGYRMALAPDQLDLSRFNAALARARQAPPAEAVAGLRGALALWRGQVLTGNGGRVIDAIAAVLEERRQAAAERMLELRLSLGEAREIVDELRDWVSQYPLRESLLGMLMTALYRSGRQAEALEEYNALRRRLADDLGIDPGRELAGLYEQILRNSPELDASVNARDDETLVLTSPPPQALPYDLPDFVERPAELRALLDAGLEHTERFVKLVAIDGMPGSGKTALAVHAAHLLAPNFPDGQLFIDLRGFSVGARPTHPAEALDTLLSALGVPRRRIPHDAAGKSALWRTVAAARRTLLVLDNAVDSTQVQSLLPGMCCCLVIVTSRTYLAGLDGALRVPLGLLSEEEGLKLLAATLGPGRLAAEPEAAASLVLYCGRLPLALRIAAARLRNRPQWSIRHMVCRLQDADARLGELAAGNRSVAAAIGLSYAVLTPGQRELFRLLGAVSACDFDAYVAAAISGRPLAATEKLLEELLSAHLLEPTSDTHYILHELIRDYARTIVPDPGDADPASAMRRMLDYYLTVAGIAAGLLQPGHRPARAEGPQAAADMPLIRDPEAALAWFDVERKNLTSAVSSAISAGLPQHASRLADELDFYLKLRGHYEEELESLVSLQNSVQNV